MAPWGGQTRSRPRSWPGEPGCGRYHRDGACQSGRSGAWTGSRPPVARIAAPPRS